jgi:hypothetical protein
MMGDRSAWQHRFLLWREILRLTRKDMTPGQREERATELASANGNGHRHASATA